MKKAKSELNGAWEERGVLGTRVEIDGKRIAVLWRSGVVLDTTFCAEKSDDGLLLVLKETGLRYAGAASDYAAVERLFYRDGELELTKSFPISGLSSETLTRTENSRYGNYELAPDMLRELQGTWKNDDGFFEIVIRKDSFTLNGEKTHICVLRAKEPSESPGRYLIADRDPSVFEWRGFSRFTYENGVLSANLLVCDAPSETVTFQKATS